MEDYMNVKGRIFNIQRFSVHDGPGVRTIVFLKGCPLRCRWCCNPESQKYDIETMVQNGKETTVGRDVTIAEVMEQVEKDRSYYRLSGGGLTLSGGECLTQADFSAALLKCAKQNGINTAIETTASMPFGVIEKLLPYLDTCLMDIKHMDSQKHKEFTTKPNELILENAVRLAKSGVKLIIRTPVIPGFNDGEEDIAAIARFASSLSGVEWMHILPYHRIGTDKYKGLGRTYTLPDILPPPNEQMEKLKKIVESYGLNCQIGG